MDWLEKHAHRRYNPLTNKWVLVSPQRLTRPWLGRTEASAAAPAPAYDPECYLCPGNLRAGSQRNPRYTSTFVFDNDYPSLTDDEAGHELNEAGLLLARSDPGICRVVCFSPRHDTSLAELSPAEIGTVVDTWIDQLETLRQMPWVRYVQIFENRGAAMGASNPHPHCQIWANATLPDIPAEEQAAQLAYLKQRGTCLLCDYVALERSRGQRIVHEDGAFTAMVPFWAVWPFELLVVPNRHVASLDQLGTAERGSLADMLKQVTQRYDGLFDASCPYSMGFHQRPLDAQPHDEWHVHAHFYSPVLRSASIHKFMVGYELLATQQRDLTPEAAAAALRGVAVQTEA